MQAQGTPLRLGTDDVDPDPGYMYPLQMVSFRLVVEVSLCFLGMGPGPEEISSGLDQKLAEVEAMERSRVSKGGVAED